MTLRRDLLAAVAALGLGLTPLVYAAPAQAVGCISGALAGGVAGHYAGHHAVAGAVGGCIVGHHLHTLQRRKEAAARAAAAQGHAPNPVAPSTDPATQPVNHTD